MTRRPRLNIIALLAVNAILAGCGRAERHVYRQVLMGVETRVVLYADDEHAAFEAARAAFDRMAALENVLSDWQASSEVRRFPADGDWHDASTDLLTTIDHARAIGIATGGAFDITQAPVVRLWRTARRSGVMPDAEDLRSARARTGWDRIDLDLERGRLRLAPATELDFGGIGKGAAADAALAVLADHGVTSALVEVGGDIAVSAPPPHERHWVVEAADGEGRTRTIELTRGAIATSGATAQFVEIDGVRYGHIVDPRTGLGLTARGAVTVIARDGATADALASALSVIGPVESGPVVDAFGAEAWWWDVISPDRTPDTRQ